MSLHNLRILTIIVDKGSFAAAADHLGLTQSAVSLQIKKLEEELGAPLFERAGRSLKLNANGRVALERARDILTLYDGIKAALAPQNIFRGTLRLGVVNSVIYGSLLPVLRRLQLKYEDLQVSLQCDLSAELATLVEHGDLDAALVTEPPFALSPGMEWRPFDEELIFVVSPPDAQVKTMRQLFEKYSYVRFDKTAWVGAMIEGELMAQGIKPRDVMEFDSLEAALNLVEHGFGIAIVPLGRSRAKEAARKFTLTPFGDPQLHRRIGMYQKVNHPHHLLNNLILDELISECGYIKNT